MYTFCYKGVYVHAYINDERCNFFNLFTNKVVFCNSVQSAKNKITRMLKERG